MQGNVEQQTSACFALLYKRMQMKTVICLLICLSTIISVTAKEKKSISWFEPGSGKAGTEVIIGVKGFDVEDKSIGVFFGNKEAHLLKKTSDHFVVIVPEGCADGPIVIKDAAGQIASVSVFITGNKAKITAPIPGIALANMAKSALVPVEHTEVTLKHKETIRQQGSLKDSNEITPPIAPRKVMPLFKNKKVITPSTSVVASATRDITPAPTGKENLSKPEHTVDNGKLPVSNTLERPLILGFEPKNGPTGTVVRISGLNFGFDKNNVSVNLKGGQSLVVNSVYDQIIEVTIPAGKHQSGSLVVIVNGKKSVSHDSFKIP